MQCSLASVSGRLAHSLSMRSRHYFHDGGERSANQNQSLRPFLTRVTLVHSSHLTLAPRPGWSDTLARVCVRAGLRKGYTIRHQPLVNTSLCTRIYTANSTAVGISWSWGHQARVYMFSRLDYIRRILPEAPLKNLVRTLAESSTVAPTCTQRVPRFLCVAMHLQSCCTAKKPCGGGGGDTTCPKKPVMAVAQEKTGNSDLMTLLYSVLFSVCIFLGWPPWLLESCTASPSPRLNKDFSALPLHVAQAEGTPTTK